MRIIAVRHTKVREGIAYGQYDIEPDPNWFELQAAPVLTELSHYIHENGQPNIVLCSPLIRCRKLCNYCGYTNIAVMEPRIMEATIGDWEGKKFEELPIDLLWQWEHDYLTVNPPNGERFVDLMLRIKHMLQGMQMYDTVLMFTHGGPILAMLALAGKIHVDKDMLLRELPANGSVTIIDYECSR